MLVKRQICSVSTTPHPCHSHFCCWFLPIWPKLDFWTENGAYGLCRLGWRYNGAKLYFSWPYMMVSMIWNTPELSPSHAAVPQPFLLLMAANLVLSVFLCSNFSLWHVSAWLVVQQSKDLFSLNLYVIINDIKYFLTLCITPQPCHSHFCCWLLPIWP